MTPKKILFACAPFDGHFSPLTGLAVHLQKQGHDVRWYTQDFYREKLKKLKIQHYPFLHADQINQENLEKVFPERAGITNKIQKLNFDIRKVFIAQGPLYYKDIERIRRKFDFDLLIADSLFTGIPYVKELMKKHVFTIGVVPLTESSKDLAPAGLAITPTSSFLGKRKQDILRFVAQKILFGKSNRISHRTLKKHGIESNYFIFDEMIKRSTLVLQSGVPGFEYFRSDMSSNIRFIGPLLPHNMRRQQAFKMPENLHYDRVVLVTQGTVEKDVTKLIVPVLEAFRFTNTLVIATTGGSSTQELRALYSDKNFIIEDYIPFSEVLPHCDVFITNGGYGGVMMGIQNKVPMVVAGVHEGKNEICARVGYFKIGINLKTEKPKAGQLVSAVNRISVDGSFKENISRMAREFSLYDTNHLLEHYMGLVFNESPRMKFTARVENICLC